MAHREYKDWLKAFLEYAEPSSETPFDMLFWVGVSAVAGALQRKVWIDQGRYQLYPNFFIVLVAPAGVIQKSTTINEAMALLKKVPDIKFAPDATTWEGFIKFMEESHQADNIITEDLDQEQTKSSAITICASELSTFVDPTNKYMLSALTKLWDCEDTFVKLTKFSGTEEIEKPCLNLIGGTTPAWMRDSFDRWSREGGFVSRTIFIYGDKKRQLIAFPKKKHTSSRDQTRVKLINDLAAISTLRGEFKLTEKCMDIGEIWYAEHNKRVHEANYVDSSGFKDRKQSHILKLAMVLSASRGESKIITDEHWAEAVELVEQAEKCFPKAFSSIDERAELRPYYELREAIKIAGAAGIEKQALLSRFANKHLLREMKAAIEMLAEAGEVDKANRDGKLYLIWQGKEK